MVIQELMTWKRAFEGAGDQMGKGDALQSEAMIGVELKLNVPAKPCCSCEVSGLRIHELPYGTSVHVLLFAGI